MAVVVKERKEKKRERNKDTKDEKVKTRSLEELQCLVTTLCTYDALLNADRSFIDFLTPAAVAHRVL